MTMVIPTPLPPSVVRHPDDVAILGTVVASNADVLISGDKDLLVLASFRTIPILSPRQFHDRLGLTPP